MKNKIKKTNSPDFDKIQQTLAAEWLERSKEGNLSDSVESTNAKNEDLLHHQA